MGGIATASANHVGRRPLARPSHWASSVSCSIARPPVAGEAQGGNPMKTSLLFSSVLVGATTIWSAPAFAQGTTTTTTSTTPAAAPAAPVIVNNTSASRAEGTPRLYPGLTWGG